MTLLDRVCVLLDAAQIPHALIGAAALAARGVARSTYDIDMLTTDVRVLAAALWEPLRAAEVGVDIQRGDRDDPLGGVIRVTAVLKLYAGGTQDQWDVRALLELPERDELVVQVDEDVADMSEEMRGRWAGLRP